MVDAAAEVAKLSSMAAGKADLSPQILQQVRQQQDVLAAQDPLAVAEAAPAQASAEARRTSLQTERDISLMLCLWIFRNCSSSGKSSRFLHDPNPNCKPSPV
jgi:hypothetical protein